jgi:hypothetical protein
MHAVPRNIRAFHSPRCLIGKHDIDQIGRVKNRGRQTNPRELMSAGIFIGWPEPAIYFTTINVNG